MTGLSLRHLFCAQYDCQPEEYEIRAFRELLYGHAKLIAIPVSKLRPALFEKDFRFIRDLGEAMDLREAKVAAASFQDANGGRPNVLRNKLKLRVSGMKATKLAHRLFSGGSGELIKFT
jgi:hypothetical protein